MIQTKCDALYICEIKFSKQKIGLKVVEEIQQKMDRLALSKRFSLRPVIIHVNGVSDQLAESGFFTHSINFSDFIE